MFGKSKRKEREAALAEARARRERAKESAPVAAAPDEVTAKAYAIMAKMGPPKNHAEMTREELVAALEKRSQALAKLWDVYDRLETDNKDLRKRIELLEQQNTAGPPPKVAREAGQDR
jgi:hypothetical protein